MKILGLILAGGKSSRMGTSKALLDVNGVTLLEHMQGIVQVSALDDIVISANPDIKEALQKTKTICGGRVGSDFIFIEDKFANKGPLSGIHSALVQYPQHHLLVVPVDMPLLSAQWIHRIIQYAREHQTNTCSTIGALENQQAQFFHFPIFVQNNENTRHQLTQQLSQESGHSVFKFLQHFPLQYVVASDHEILSNVNSTPQWQDVLVKLGA